MTILVATQFALLEFAYARLLRAKSARAMAAAATEDDLRRFPAAAWCRSQEANTIAWDLIRRSSRWGRVRDTICGALALRADAVDRLAAQMFMMTWGRRLAALRICFSTIDGPIAVVTDLPRPILASLLSEYPNRIVERRILSMPLRCALAARDCGRLLGRHVLRAARLLKLLALPRPAAPRDQYVAWLGALPSEMAQGADRFSVIEFLGEGRQSIPGLEVVLQGAAPDRALPAKMRHRAHAPALRHCASPAAVFEAVWKQAVEAARDFAHCADFRSTTLLGPLKFDVPAYRLWFEQDRPSAILYANHQIGGECAASLMDDHPPTAMVFYSANVAYRPQNVNAPGTPLEPEMRYIVADRLTMWSDDMAEGFRTADYEPARLALTGPIFFGRQAKFTRARRGVSGRARIGIFDVAVLRSEARFAAGYGLLTYDHENQQRFFSDIFAAVRARFGDEAVIVRKGKRAHHPVFEHDPDFSRFGPIRIEEHDPMENLWRVLETVDLVLCMPFTSVAYFADECGIPAAYYDPRGETEPSPLGGRAPLLLGRDRLESWLGAPALPFPRVPSCVASAVIAAASGARASIQASIAGRKRENVVHT